MPDLLDLIPSVKSASNDLISLDELLQLDTQFVVLLVEQVQVLVQGLDLLLHLVLVRLVLPVLGTQGVNIKLHMLRFSFQFPFGRISLLEDGFQILAPVILALVLLLEVVLLVPQLLVRLLLIHQLFVQVLSFEVLLFGLVRRLGYLVG